LLIQVSCNQTEKNTKQENGTLKGNITISGAFALYPLTVKWAEEFKKIHPDVTIDVSAGGAGKGMVDVLSNMVDIAMFSRGLKPEESSKGAWPLAVAKDAVVATINISNPLKDKILECGITKQQLSDIFLDNKYKTWGELFKTNDKSKINVFTRSDACGAGEMWGKFFGKSQENLKGVQVFGDPGIASAIKGDKNSIGYNNVGFAYDIRSRKYNDGIMAVPIDLNSDGKIDATESFYESLDSLNAAIKKGIYPEPPARDLYLITKGKPTNEIVKAFMEWILTEGQKYVNEAGYVKLTDEKITGEQGKLK
jgi:phosphate transport system substrate-binding protein